MYKNQNENESESDYYHSDFFFILTLFVTLNTFIHMFDFQNLEVYKKSKNFHISIQNLIKANSLNKSISDQLFRASLSIPLNIAEGSGRFSKPDRRNFFIIARSSIFESVAILDILADTGVLSNEDFKIFESKADELSRILFAMIKNLSQKSE